VISNVGHMREKYLFEFPYQLPAQRACGDEQNQYVYILAESYKDVLAWGAEIAEKYYSLMDDVGSWKADFGEGVIVMKPEKDETLTPSRLATFAVVNVGEFPDMSTWPLK